MKINQLHEDHYSTMEPGKRIDQEKKDRELGIGHDWELKPGDTQPTYIGDLANHPDLQPQTDFITDIPANKGEEPNPYIEKLKDLGGWYLDTVIDAGKSIGRGIKSQVTGVKDFGKRRWDSFQQDVVNDDINRLRTLSGLMEKDEDVWAYSPQGASDIVARIVKTDYGFQVYVRGPHGWIAQGQPPKSQEEAEADPDNVWYPGEHCYDPGHSSGLYQKTKAIRDDQFTAPVVKAIQELDAKNTALEARVATLEG